MMFNRKEKVYSIAEWKAEREKKELEKFLANFKKEIKQVATSAGSFALLGIDAFEELITKMLDGIREFAFHVGSGAVITLSILSAFAGVMCIIAGKKGQGLNMLKNVGFGILVFVAFMFMINMVIPDMLKDIEFIKTDF